MSPPSTTYGPLTDGETPAVARVLSWCFGFTPDDAVAWMDRSGKQHVRVLREGAEPVATLMLVPMGQFFGGRSVPMTGIVAVGSIPHKRGGGHAERLMAETVRELHRSGVALSTLYPATRALYRRVGYEPAGGRFLGSAQISEIRVRATEPAVRPMEDADQNVVAALYSAHAAEQNGLLDRGPYIWDRIRAPRMEPAPPRGFVIEGASGPEGYFFVFQKPSTPPRTDLRLTDLVARTGAAARRALAFFAHHWTLCDKVHIATGPGDPLDVAFPEVAFKQELWLHWMLRVVDVPRALAARGYPVGIETEVHFDVTDDVVPENAGRWVLQVSGGRGEVMRGGRGAIRLHVRGLAPLYASFLSPLALRTAGLLEGDAAELARAALAFAGPAPWMPDHF